MSIVFLKDNDDVCDETGHDPCRLEVLVARNCKISLLDEHKPLLFAIRLPICFLCVVKHHPIGHFGGEKFCDCEPYKDQIVQVLLETTQYLVDYKSRPILGLYCELRSRCQHSDKAIETNVRNRPK